jgi:hypothetical protein
MLAFGLPFHLTHWRFQICLVFGNLFDRQVFHLENWSGVNFCSSVLLRNNQKCCRVKLVKRNWQIPSDKLNMKVENDMKIWRSDQLYYELTSKMCQAYRGQAGIEMDGTKGVDAAGKGWLNKEAIKPLEGNRPIIFTSATFWMVTLYKKTLWHLTVIFSSKFNDPLNIWHQLSASWLCCTYTLEF